MYKRFHKLHHGFKQPTAWSATAIHPVELVNLQLLYISLLFVIPTHLCELKILTIIKLTFTTFREKLVFPSFLHSLFQFASFASCCTTTTTGCSTTRESSSSRAGSRGSPTRPFTTTTISTPTSITDSTCSCGTRYGIAIFLQSAQLNCVCLFFQMYGTHRREGRIYNENIFSGKGKDVAEATKEELELYDAEVLTENKNKFKPSLVERVLKRIT